VATTHRRDGGGGEEEVFTDTAAHIRDATTPDHPGPGPAKPETRPPPASGFFFWLITGLLEIVIQ
jgi:hypothetical protein